MNQEDRPSQVHVERLRPGFGRVLTHHLRERVRRIVHHHVHATERIDGLRDEHAKVVEIIHACGNTERFGTDFPKVLLGLLAGVGLATRSDDPCASGGVPLGESAADAAGTARHDHHATAHVEE